MHTVLEGLGIIVTDLTNYTVNVQKSIYFLDRILLTGSGSGERWSPGRALDYPFDGGSIPSTAVSKLRQFRSPDICLCLSKGTLKAGGPFYLMSMPGEVKDPTQGVNV